MLAREYCDSIKRKNKPIILSHPMLMGLKEGQAKMSKSDPDSAIWMEDEAADVKARWNNTATQCTSHSPLQSKIKKAFCPPAVAEANPCLQYVRLVALPWSGEFKICRLADCGGDKARARLSLSLLQAQPSLSQVYQSYDELEADYVAGSVHPGDLKASSPRASSSLLLIPFIPGWAGGRIERHPGAGSAALQDKRRRSRASGQGQGFQGDALNEFACLAARPSARPPPDPTATAAALRIRRWLSSTSQSCSAGRRARERRLPGRRRACTCG